MLQNLSFLPNTLSHPLGHVLPIACHIFSCPSRRLRRPYQSSLITRCAYSCRNLATEHVGIHEDRHSPHSCCDRIHLSRWEPSRAGPPSRKFWWLGTYLGRSTTEGSALCTGPYNVRLCFFQAIQPNYKFCRSCTVSTASVMPTTRFPKSTILLELKGRKCRLKSYPRGIKSTFTFNLRQYLKPLKKNGTRKCHARQQWPQAKFCPDQDQTVSVIERGPDYTQSEICGGNILRMLRSVTTGMVGLLILTAWKDRRTLCGENHTLVHDETNEAEDAGFHHQPLVQGVGDLPDMSEPTHTLPSPTTTARHDPFRRRIQQCQIYLQLKTEPPQADFLIAGGPWLLKSVSNHSCSLTK